MPVNPPHAPNPPQTHLAHPAPSGDNTLNNPNAPPAQESSNGLGNG